MGAEDHPAAGFYTTDLDAVEAAQVLQLDPITQPTELSAMEQWGEIRLPLPVMHVALEHAVAGVLDLSWFQIERVQGEDLHLDKDGVTWEEEDAPDGVGTGIAAIVDAVDGRYPLVDVVPIPPPSERSAQTTSDAVEILEACAAVQAGTEGAHQMLYEAVWMLVHNVQEAG